MNKIIIANLIVMGFIISVFGVVGAMDYYHIIGTDNYRVELFVELNEDFMNLAISHPAVVEYGLDEMKGHWFVLDTNELDWEETVKYLRGLEFKQEFNNDNAINIPVGVAMPNCFWDYGTTQPVGVYVYNSQLTYIQNDPKCQ